MDHKDYALIARALHSARSKAKLIDKAVIGDAAEELAVALCKADPEFPMDKFWRTVNLGE